MVRKRRGANGRRRGTYATSAVHNIFPVQDSIWALYVTTPRINEYGAEESNLLDSVILLLNVNTVANVKLVLYG